MWNLITSIVSLVLLIFQEYFSAQARARSENRRFELDQAALKDLVDGAVRTWVQRNSQDSSGQGSAWDVADRDSVAQEVSHRAAIPENQKKE